AGLTYWELAEALDVSAQTVSNWCTGRHQFRLKHLTEIAELLRARGIPPATVAAFVRQELASQGLTAALLDSREPVAPLPSRIVALVHWSKKRIGATVELAFRTIMKRAGYETIIVSCLEDHALKHASIDFLLARGGIVGLALFMTGELPDPS